MPSTPGPGEPRLIVFDLDGTLVDSRQDLADSANALLADHGRAPLATAEVAAMVGEGARVLVERVLAAAALRVDLDEALGRFLALYDTRLVSRTRPYDGVPRVLCRLAGRSRLAVLTNKPAAPSRRVLQHFNLLPLFHAVVGGDGPHPRKPAPDGLLALMAQAGAAIHETLFVGDSMVDVETARAAGVPLVLAGYGFGCSSVDRERLHAGDTVIGHPEELLALVTGVWRRPPGEPR